MLLLLLLLLVIVNVYMVDRVVVAIRKKRKQFICGWGEKKLFIKATIERNTHAYNVRVHNIIWQEISGR